MHGMERRAKVFSLPHMRPRFANDGPSPHAVGSSPPKRFTLMYLQRADATHAKSKGGHQRERETWRAARGPQEQPAYSSDRAGILPSSPHASGSVPVWQDREWPTKKL